MDINLNMPLEITDIFRLQRRDESDRMARREELDFFLGRLESSLDKNDFQIEPGRRQIVHRSIRNIFQRVRFYNKIFFTERFWCCKMCLYTFNSTSYAFLPFFR